MQDKQTFLHVNYFANDHVSWQSVGLLLADSLEDARSTSVTGSASSSSSSSKQTRTTSSSSTRGGGRLLRAAASTTQLGSQPRPQQQQRRPPYNYVLAADTDSIVPQLQRLGAVEGPTPCLIYLNSNVTLSKPPVPAAGITMARPLAIVGMAHRNVSIDWHMQVRAQSMALRVFESGVLCGAVAGGCVDSSCPGVCVKGVWGLLNPANAALVLALHLHLLRTPAAAAAGQPNHDALQALKHHV